MRRPGLDGGSWPSDQVEDLLRAALLDPAPAREAWDRVAPTLAVTWHGLGEVQRTLPLVLGTIGADAMGPHGAAAKRLHREAWRDNRLHLHHAHRWVEALGGEVPVLVLKGMALATTAYADLGRRPMHDIDLLVPEDRIGRALDLLLAAGWVAADGTSIPRSWRTRHGAPLVHPDGGHIDVHRVPGVPFMRRRGDRSAPTFWDRTRPLDVGGHRLARPASEDLLLNVVVHGLTSVPGGSPRWVADAVLLLRHDPPDWDRLVTRARAFGVVPMARSALRYLADAFGAPVPADALWDLWAIPLPAGDRRRFDVVTSAATDGSTAADVSIIRARWARMRTAIGPAGAAMALPRFTADVVDVDRLPEVPREVARRVASRVGRRPRA
ncbi:MAG TPA: nucleotidyltransferase family protein [Aquihabitans sp.]|jgi:hypothetical protein|nr:nucleotidyltransferase family protein [Aquihabitans sp.]